MVRRMRSADFVNTTLSGGVTDVGTAWSVASSFGMPSEGDFFLACEEEIVLVRARTGLNLTVIRGQAGTTAAAHVNGSDVIGILTKEDYEKRANEHRALRALPYGRLLREGNDNQMSTANFATINIGAGTFANGNDGTLRFESRFHTGDDLSGFARGSIDSTDGDKRYTAHIGSTHYHNKEVGRIGMHIFQNSDGFIWGMEWEAGQQMRLGTRTDFNTAMSVAVSDGARNQADIWVQVDVLWNFSGSDDRLVWRYSIDGVHFWEMGTQDVVGGFNEASGIRAGILGSNRFIADNPFYCYSWYEESI